MFGETDGLKYFQSNDQTANIEIGLWLKHSQYAPTLLYKLRYGCKESIVALEISGCEGLQTSLYTKIKVTSYFFEHILQVFQSNYSRFIKKVNYKV